MEDVMYQAKNYGFIYVDSSAEGAQIGNKGNQFTAVDLTMSNALTQLINLKVTIEDTIETMTGVINQSFLG